MGEKASREVHGVVRVGVVVRGWVWFCLAGAWTELGGGVCEEGRCGEGGGGVGRMLWRGRESVDAGGGRSTHTKG